MQRRSVPEATVAHLSLRPWTPKNPRSPNSTLTTARRVAADYPKGCRCRSRRASWHRKRACGFAARLHCLSVIVGTVSSIACSPKCGCCANIHPLSMDASNVVGTNGRVSSSPSLVTKPNQRYRAVSSKPCIPNPKPVPLNKP